MAKRKSRDTTDIEDDVSETLGLPTTGKGKKKQGEYQPVYKMVGDTKIPVSKHRGSVWKGRKDAGSRRRKDADAAWKESYDYFRNDQSGHRASTGGGVAAGNTPTKGSAPNARFTETENLVFSNVTTLVAATYAKNPSVIFQADDETDKELMPTLEKLANKLMAKSQAPGLGAKMKLRRIIQTTELTNNGWAKIGWTDKTESSGQALDDLAKLSGELAEAKTTKDIQRIEAEMIALERGTDLLAPEGPLLKPVSPFNIIRDGAGDEDDLSTSNWLMERDWLLTDYINATYGKKDGETGKYKSIYKPTHFLPAANATDGVQKADKFELFASGTAEWNKQGYGTKEAFDASCYTCVWWVWDKVTRRLELYADNDWSFPIWVWDDPYKLERFFPYYKLAYYQDPDGGDTKGEVTYYLDQQDAINEINSCMRNTRHSLLYSKIFNKNLVSKPEDVEILLNGVDGMARGIDFKPDADPKMLWIEVPSLPDKYQSLFQQDKQEKMQAINRISSMSDVLSGVQFKTNTTNKAIDAYQQSSGIRVDEKIDLIEDYVGDIMWGIMQICLQKMTMEQVEELIGTQHSAGWTNRTPEEVRSISCRVVGGSSTKPTSRARKEEAIGLGQALGQFAQAAPFAVVKMVEVMEKAFDELTMTSQDWKDLKTSIAMSQMNMGGTGAGAPPPGAGGPPPAGGGAAAPEGAPPEQLPPELAGAVAQLVEQGIPEESAIQMVMDEVAKQQQPS